MISSLFRIAFALEQKYLGKGLQTLFPCHLGSRPALGFIWQVDILELSGIPTLIDALGEFWCHLFKVGNGLDDGLLALQDVLETFVLVADGCDLNLVEPARSFLAITGDEWYRTPFVEQGEGIADSPFLKIELLGNEVCKDVLFHTIR